MEQILSNYSSDLVEKAARIKAIFFDVDGILTDGKILYDDRGNETTKLNIRDGLMISQLRKAGIITGVISSRESALVAKRCTELKIDFCRQAVTDKLVLCEKLMEDYTLKKEEVIFIGNDVSDLPVFKMVGISACPANAPTYVQDNVYFVTSAKRGEGVLREIADLVLLARADGKKVVNE